MFISFLGAGVEELWWYCVVVSHVDSVSGGPAATIFRFKVIWFIIISGYVGNDEKWSLQRPTTEWEDENMGL